MFNHILVAVDVTTLDPVHRLLAVARRNLLPSGQLTLLHVLDPVPGYVASQIDGDVRQKAREAIVATLTAIAKSENLPSTTQLKVVTGNPYRKIIELAGNSNDHAIAIASHTPAVSDVILGSVASQVVKHAQCSVLIVRSAH